MYLGGTFPCYFINTAYLKKPENTGRLVSIRKPRVAPKYGQIQVEKPTSHQKWYSQNRTQRVYDKLMLKAMSDMEGTRGTKLYMKGDPVGSSVPLPPTPELLTSKHIPYILHASNTSNRYSRNLKGSPLPLRYSDTPYETQRLLQHDILARSSLSSYASRNNIPSPMRALYSRHVTSRQTTASQPVSSLSPRQVTYVNIIIKQTSSLHPYDLNRLTDFLNFPRCVNTIRPL
ncbi:hypothetical protein LOD99_384 [Oopsacas minuta]|uniref:Uncharacterized protein n=1 Tax=Oopsacas minuta TaxID=111878 RepID=A0AAV7KBG6_9METZ|nr:hypothetical protein LOD99_384 [Oopsacas minuta]